MTTIETSAPFGLAAEAADVRTLAASLKVMTADLPPMPDVTAIDLLHTIRTARQDLTLAERALEDAAVKAMTSDRATLDGRWTAERRFGKDRKEWDHERLQSEVVQRAIDTARVNPETGEIRDGVEPNATTWAVRDALIACARPEWRVTALKVMGIAPDDYCTAIKGRATVTVTPAEGAS